MEVTSTISKGRIWLQGAAHTMAAPWSCGKRHSLTQRAWSIPRQQEDLSNHPLVVHKKNAHGVYIGRPSIWGDPFEIGPDGTRGEVIRKYEDWIPGGTSLPQPELGKTMQDLIEGDWLLGRTRKGRLRSSRL